MEVGCCFAPLGLRVVVEMREKGVAVYGGCRVRTVVVLCWCCNTIERLDWGVSMIKGIGLWLQHGETS